jgi:hypothetical protein
MLAHLISITLLLTAALPSVACARGVRLGGATEFAAGGAPAQGSLQDRMEAALREARARGGDARVWTVYSFKPHKGVGLDGEPPQGANGQITVYGLRVEMNSASPSANVGLFLLHDLSDNSIEKVELHDLDRYRAQPELPVRRLGAADNGESLALLRGLFERRPGGQVGERLVMAMAIHDGPEVEPLLKSILAGDYAEKEQAQAALWLGQLPGQKSFLEALARDGRRSEEVRKQAVVGIGFSQSPGALSTLRSLYETVEDREVKEQCLFAATVTEDKKGAAAFLQQVKASDPSPDLRRQASLWLDRVNAGHDF